MDLERVLEVQKVLVRCSFAKMYCGNYSLFGAAEKHVFSYAFKWLCFKLAQLSDSGQCKMKQAGAAAFICTLIAPKLC